MNALFLDYVKMGNYQHAKKEIESMTPRALYGFIVDSAFDGELFALYTFITFLLFEKETAMLHFTAGALSAQAFIYIDGSESMGLFHARRAVELAPEDFRYKEYLLYYYGIPDNLLCEKEAIEVAHALQLQNPDNLAASSFFQDIKGGIPEYLKEKVPHKEGES